MASKLDKYKDEIIRLYVEERLPGVDIAERFGVNSGTVYRLLHTHNIPMHETSEYQYYSKSRLDPFKEEIAELYREGCTLKDIGKHFAISAPAIGSFLRKHGIEMRKRFELYPYKEEIIRLYTAGLSCVAIGRKFGVTLTGIAHFLHRHGVEVRHNCENPGQRYSYDRTFFDNIDTEGKAYFLGLLFADGCNCKGIISLHLHQQDRELVEKVHALIPGAPPIGMKRPNSEASRVYGFSIGSKYMCASLERLGMHPAKSLTLRFPRIGNGEGYIPEHLIRHFVRGYSDGDGNIRSYRNGISVNARLCGTMSFMVSLGELVQRELGIENPRICRIGRNADLWGACEFSIEGNRARRFLAWLYDDAAIFMKRKHDVYSEIMKKWYSWTPGDKVIKLKDEVIRMHAEDGLTAKAIGRQLDINGHEVWRLLLRNGFDVAKRGTLAAHEDEVHRLYVEEGLSATAIGDRFGVSDKSVRRLLRKRGVVIRQSWEYANKHQAIAGDDSDQQLEFALGDD